MDKNKLIHNILKAIQEGPEPKPQNYNLENQEWLDVLMFLKNEGYVQNMLILLYGPKNPYMIWLDWATLTPKGKSFLENNELKY